jgi:hypothetical protein
MVSCQYCGEEAVLCNGLEVYPKRPDLKGLSFWVCHPCKARVGTHKGTTKPLGRLANTQLRFWKIQAHNAFDPKWRGGVLSRREAYAWLAAELDLNPSSCHIGMFDVDTCKRVVEVCTD